MIAGSVGYGLSRALFVYALRDLGKSRTSAYFSVAPFVGAMVAVVFPDEPFTVALMIAGALMGWGVWLHVTERHLHAPGSHTHRHTHEPLRHQHPHFPDAHHRHDH